MADDVGAAVITTDFEITVVGRQPTIQYFGHLDLPVVEPDAARFFLAPVTGVACHADPQCGFGQERKPNLRATQMGCHIWNSEVRIITVDAKV